MALLFARLGLSARLILILLSALVALLAVGGVVDYLSRHEQPRGYLPEQVGAAVALLDKAPAVEQPTIMKAINSAELQLYLRKVRPTDMGSTSTRLPGVEWLISQYLDALQGREVLATFEPESTTSLPALFERLVPNSRAPISIAVRLTDGQWAVFAARGSPIGRVLGVPPGFWIGGFGAALSLMAVLAIWREAKPIGELAQSVSAFAGDASPRPVQVTGAPDVRALIDASNEMQTRIAGLIKGRTLLLGAVSHDLRTFVTRLRLRVELMDDETQRNKAVQDLDDMSLLIEDALALARGRTSGERRQAVDIVGVIAEETREHDGDKVKLVSAPASVTVTGDPTALRRLFVNLIDNAARYARHAEIRIEAIGGDVHVLVDDDGPGIAVAERDAIFEPFYRIEASRNRATGGTGLGLAIAQQTADAHGGSICVEASPLGGARFRVVLPALR